MKKYLTTVCIFGILFFPKTLLAEEETHYSLWMPFSGVQVNSSSLPPSKTQNTALNASASTIYWPTVEVVDFIGITYFKLDYSGLGAAFLNLLGVSNFTTTQGDVKNNATIESSNSVALIEAVGFIPHLQYGLLVGEDILNGIGLNFNQISLGYIRSGSLNYAPRKNYAQELGLQYQLVVPLFDYASTNLSATYNLLGRDWFMGSKGSSVILDCSFIFKAMSTMSIYWNMGYAKRNIKLENPGVENFNSEKLSIGSFTMRLAVAFHNVNFFGSEFGSN